MLSAKKKEGKKEGEGEEDREARVWGVGGRESCENFTR